MSITKDSQLVGMQQVSEAVAYNLKAIRVTRNRAIYQGTG